MEIDAGRAEKWDQGAEDASVTKAIVRRLEPKLDKLNGTVAALQEESLIQKGMLMATRLILGLMFAAISASAGIAGVVALVIKFGN